MLAKLLKFNEEKFIELYLKQYGKEGEDFVACANRCINEGIPSTGTDEGDFLSIVKQCLPANADKKIYKMRSFGKESQLKKAFNSLRLEVGPKFN